MAPVMFFTVSLAQAESKTKKDKERALTTEIIKHNVFWLNPQIGEHFNAA